MHAPSSPPAPPPPQHTQTYLLADFIYIYLLASKCICSKQAELEKHMLATCLSSYIAVLPNTRNPTRLPGFPLSADGRSRLARRVLHGCVSMQGGWRACRSISEVSGWDDGGRMTAPSSHIASELLPPSSWDKHGGGRSSLGPCPTEPGLALLLCWSPVGFFWQTTTSRTSRD